MDAEVAQMERELEAMLVGAEMELEEKELEASGVALCGCLLVTEASVVCV